MRSRELCPSNPDQFLIDNATCLSSTPGLGRRKHTAHV